MSLPHQQRAVLGQLPTAERTALYCTNAHNLPALKPDGVLVKTYHVALNPYDWKGVRYNFALKTAPAVLGRDGSGIVVAVGESVSEYKAGDRVSLHCAGDPLTPGMVLLQRCLPRIRCVPRVLRAPRV